MTTKISHRLLSLALVCASAMVAMGCSSPVRAQTVVVMVNGEPITNYDIEQRSKLTFLSNHKPPVRQDVINELIDEKVKIKEAKKYTVDPSKCRYRPGVRLHEFADAHNPRSTHQNSRGSGHSAGYDEATYKGRDGLEQPGARTLQGEPAGRREGGGGGGRRRRGQGQRRQTGNRELRIQDAADRFDRAARISALRHRD